MKDKEGLLIILIKSWKLCRLMSCLIHRCRLKTRLGSKLQIFCRIETGQGFLRSLELFFLDYCWILTLD